MGQLGLRNLTIRYNSKPVIRDLSLDINDGEMVSLLGPSGVGKTTILKAIAGLLQPDSGSILLNGEPVNHLPPEQRDAVLIFQKPLLFPFLDVGQNIGFGLKMAKVKKPVAAKQIDKIMEITGLGNFKHRKIHQLSGGQQQRVALARGLVLEPSVLLLDEPLSSLDAELRQQMRELICTIQNQTGTTMLFVTHDQSEALAISDRICVLLDGRLRQSGTPAEIFYQPADADVARFFGCTNFISGTINNGTFKSGAISCATSLDDSPETIAVIRPEDIVLSSSKRNNTMSGKVVEIQFEGATTRVTIKAEERTFTALTLRPDFTKEQPVWLHFPPDRLHFLPATAKP
ncbi:ABC transporter ATP-binding protein [Desulfopila sp. IMCC35006]|uniref:ABC transporter ATP-binding protein n=1 Tax=Desulfopila sp. IMCC35006 TaxID=2569542 RepID=UPI0010AC5CAB|nr:ABC transporter ATP-binding protein [Desulfopila sp. IMCC35006]TKB25506.1 ABC transporter ATP-binding protein [Desulfopila sp. IMCC35006]